MEHTYIKKGSYIMKQNEDNPTIGILISTLKIWPQAGVPASCLSACEGKTQDESMDISLDYYLGTVRTPEMDEIASQLAGAAPQHDEPRFGEMKKKKI